MNRTTTTGQTRTTSSSSLPCRWSSA